MSTTVNGQITDSITQVNTETIGVAPAVAMGNLFQAGSQSLGNALLNSSHAQQQGNLLAEAITTTGVALIIASGKP